MAHKHRPMIQRRFLCKVNILIPREINPAGEKGLSKTETQANSGYTFSFSVNEKKKKKKKTGDAT